MDPLSGISKSGFKRWYERQLIEAFAYLVTALLSMLLMLVLLERAEFGAITVSSFASIGTAFLAGGIAFVAGRRFISMLAQAEYYGHQSSCPECGAYAKFDVVAFTARGQQSTLEVACCRCRRHWHLS